MQQALRIANYFNSMPSILMAFQYLYDQSKDARNAHGLPYDRGTLNCIKEEFLVPTKKVPYDHACQYFFQALSDLEVAHNPIYPEDIRRHALGQAQRLGEVAETLTTALTETPDDAKRLHNLLVAGRYHALRYTLDHPENTPKKLFEDVSTEARELEAAGVANMPEYLAFTTQSSPEQTRFKLQDATEVRMQKIAKNAPSK